MAVSLPHSDFTAFLADEPDVKIVAGSGTNMHSIHIGMYDVGAHLTLYAPTSALVALRDAIGPRLGATAVLPLGPVGLRKLIVDVAAHGDDEDSAGVSIDDVTADRIVAAILARLGGA